MTDNRNQINRREAADRIAARLFRNGSGEAAKRLVLELQDGRDGGGWCRRAVVERVEEILVGIVLEDESIRGTQQ